MSSRDQACWGRVAIFNGVAGRFLLGKSIEQEQSHRWGNKGTEMRLVPRAPVCSPVSLLWTMGAKHKWSSSQRGQPRGCAHGEPHTQVQGGLQMGRL